MHVDAFAQVQELVRIIKQAGPQRTQFFSREKMSNDKLGYARLYKIIANNPDATEQQVAEQALGVGPKDNAYLVQRSTLKEMLLNSLFALDVEAAQFSTYGMNVYENDKDMFATRILQTLSWPYSVKLAEQALPVALQYERWHNALFFLDALREAAAIAGDMVEFENITAEFTRVFGIYQSAQSASSVMDRILCESAKSTSEDPTIAEIARPEIARVKKKLKETPCYTLHLLLWRLQTAELQSTGRYRDALRITSAFEALVKSNYPGFINRSLLDSFARKRLTCAIRTRSYSEAMKALADGEKLLDATVSINWITFKQLEYILMMHTAKYDKAAECIRQVEESGKLTLVPAVHRDKWKIFEAYTRLALSDPTLKFNRRNLDARLQRDKAGTNGAAIVLELLLLLRAQQLGELRDRAEAIGGYVKRHLGDKEVRQIRRIFDLILLVSDNDGNHERLQARAEKLLKEDREDRSSDPVAGFQIIPIETLWGWILSWGQKKA